MKKVSTKIKLLVAGIAAVILAGALFVGGMTLLEWDFTKLDSTVWNYKSFCPTEPVEELATVDIDCAMTEVDISFGNEFLNELSIEYEESDRTTYDIRLDSSGLSIEERNKFVFRMFNFRSPKMKIVLPRTQSLRVNLLNGEINFSGAEFEKLELNTVNGNIALANITVSGAMSVTSVNGDLKTEEISAKSINVRTTNGKISAWGITAETSFFAKTVNGSLNVNGAKAQTVKLETVNGSIGGNYIDAQTAVLSSVNGRISGLLSGRKDEYKIECSTVNGYINVSNKSDGNRSVKASTVNGNIMLEFNGDKEEEL